MMPDMFTKADIRNGGTYLAVHLSANDYYCQNEQVQGKWYGKLAERFGIEGNAIRSDDRVFENLRRNRTPDGGQKLTPKNPGIRFFDFQCSAQKSVSVMAVTMGDTRLKEAHLKAFDVAVVELERFAATRNRAGTLNASDENRITGNICAAVFHHDASRDLDPQIHTHTVIANVTYDPVRKKHLALTEREIFKALRYAGKVYQNELARNVRELGYEIELTRENGVIKGFEIKGVPPEICRRFSKRRIEVEEGIKAFVAEHGREPSNAEKHAIACSTWTPKLIEITTPEVLRKQREQLTVSEMAELDALKQAAIERGPRQTQDQPSLSIAVDHLFERASVLQGHEVLAESLNQGLGFHTLEDHQEQLRASELVSLVENEQNPILSAEYATREGLHQEVWCRDFIDRTKGKFVPLVDNFDQRLAEAEAHSLRPDQREAARLICSSMDQVSAVRGIAGSGKTYMLQAVDAVLGDRKVYYIAPTSSAAKTLTSDGLKNATTCANFLQNIAQREDLRDAIVICDEAGLKSSRQGYALLRLAEANNMRIRFVGDSRQHVSVEAGDFLRVMETHSNLETAEVGTIERQKHREYREAIMCMAGGQVHAGLEKLDDLGWIVEGKADYLAKAADDYVRLTQCGLQLEDCLAVCPTWNENFHLTDLIRNQLKKSGALPQGVETTIYHSLKWTETQKKSVNNYHPGLRIHFNERVSGFQKGDTAEVIGVRDGQLCVRVNSQQKLLPLRTATGWDVAEPRRIDVSPGDKILIRANAKALGLVNGDTLLVQHISTNGTLHCSDGKQIPPTFKQWCHGYVITSHQAQGKTANHVVVAAAMMNQKTTYVACSRGRHQCRVHTPDKFRLMNRIPAGNRKAALDVLAQQVKAGYPERIAARVLAWAKLAADSVKTFLLPAPSKKLLAQTVARIHHNAASQQRGISHRI